MKLLSVIVPCYNEQENIQDFYDELMKNEAFFKERDVDIELVYVNDGSTDKSMEVVKNIMSFHHNILTFFIPYSWNCKNPSYFTTLFIVFIFVLKSST